MTWPRDPVLKVACSTCKAAVGVGRRRPSGHSGPFVELHAERDLLSDREGKYGPCPFGRCGRAGPINPQARPEIRQCVEDGEIGHEDVTTLWIEQWAADIYRDGLAA